MEAGTPASAYPLTEFWKAVFIGSLLLRKSHIFVAQKSEEISMKSMQQSISFVIRTKMGPFVSIIEHIIFEKFI